MNDIDLRGEKGRTELFFSFVLSCIFLGMIFYNIYTQKLLLSNNYEILGFNIGIGIVTPYIVLFAISTVFNLLSFIKHSKPFAITCAILYAVSIALLPTAYLNTIIQAILCFIAYAKMQTISEIIERRTYEEEAELREYFHRRFPKAKKNYTVDEMRDIIDRADEKKRLRKESEGL